MTDLQRLIANCGGTNGIVGSRSDFIDQHTHLEPPPSTPLDDIRAVLGELNKDATPIYGMLTHTRSSLARSIGAVEAHRWITALEEKYGRDGPKVRGETVWVCHIMAEGVTWGPASHE